MNKVITFLSPLNKNNTSFVEYEYGIEGRTGSEAALKYFIKDNDIDEVIFLVSDKVRDELVEIDNKKTTTLSYIKGVIADYCNSLGKNPPTTTDIEAETSKENIYDEIISNTVAHLNPDDNLFFDFSGGLRDIAMVNMLLLNLSRFKGIKLSQIIYTELSGKFKDLKFGDNMISLINAANEFAKYGKCNGFIEYINEHPVSESIQQLVRSMKEISDNIELGRASRVEKDIENLSKKMDDVEEEHNMFSLLIPTIRSKFFGGIENVNWLNIISWCLDNDMINQALTFFVERAPDCIFENKIIQYLGTDEEYIDIPKSTLMYEKLLDSSPKNDPKFQTFGLAMKGMSKDKTASEILETINEIQSNGHFGENLKQKNPDWLNKLSDKRKQELTDCIKRDGFVRKITNVPCYYNEINGIVQIDNPYLKKLKQIENLSQNQNGFRCDVNVAKEILIIYVYVKIIRNHVCHVSEDVEIEEVTKYLRKRSYEIEIEKTTIDAIKRNISYGISVIKNKAV